MSILGEMSRAHKERLARLGAGGDPVEAIQPIKITQDVKDKLQIGQVAVRHIQRLVCRQFGVSMEDMLSQRRNIKVTLPRMVSMLLAKEYTSKSLVDIGKFTGGRDHSTVISALERIRKLVEENEVIRAEVDKLRKLMDEGDFEDSDLQTGVETAVRNAWIIAREIEGYRRHRGARKYIAAQFCMDEIEMARDYLSRILDDVGGKK